MTEIIVKTRSGVQERLEAADGMSLMEAMRQAGIDEIVAMCGGCCSCATCHVYVAADFVDQLGAAGRDENDLLEGTEHRRATSRLSCQVQVHPELSGLEVEIAPEE